VNVEGLEWGRHRIHAEQFIRLHQQAKVCSGRGTSVKLG
jgi:hypothetical protein